MIGKIIRKSSLHDFLGKEVVLQKVANRVAASQCYWKFNTEVAISELFEKLSLDYRPKGKRIILESKNFYRKIFAERSLSP